MLMKRTLLLSALLFSAAAANAADVTATYQASAWLKSANMCNFDALAPATDTDFYVGGTDVKYTATAFNGILGAWNVAGLSGAINSVADDTVDADAPVEYFNLQGMRVINPSKGSLVIRRQGTKVAKVIF